MKKEILIEKLIEKQKEYADVYWQNAARINNYQDDLNHLFFWQSNQRKKINNFICSLKKIKRDAKFRFFAIEKMVHLLLFPLDTESFFLEDTLIVLSMLIDFLNPKEMLSVFGIAAMYSSDISFLDTFLVDGSLISYCDIEIFQKKLDSLKKKINVAYNIGSEVDFVIDCLSQAIQNINQEFMQALNNKEKEVVLEYLHRKEMDLLDEEVQMCFTLFWQAVQISVKSVDNSTLLKRRKLCFSRLQTKLLKKDKTAKSNFRCLEKSNDSNF